MTDKNASTASEPSTDSERSAAGELTAEGGEGKTVNVARRMILSPQELLEEARRNNTGRRDWRVWKEEEGRKAVELLEQSNERSGKSGGGTGRIDLLDVCFTGDLNIVYRIRMPVPRWPIDGKLRLGHSAVFHLNYREKWRWEAPAGWEPLGLFDPFDAFHPNMASARGGAICLGKLPAGVLLKELVLMGYYALSLQDHVLDETDPNGVLNIPACEYYRNHSEYLPLTRAGLADPWEPPQVESELVKL